MTARFSLIVFMMAWLGVISPARLFCGTASKADHGTTRVVSLVPNVTEIAFALGAGGQMVGVSDYCFYPPEARQLPRAGNLMNPSLETVVRLRPDVVFLFRSQADFAARLRALGIKSELFAVDSLAELYTAVEQVGAWSGQTSEAATLTGRIRNDLDGLRAARDEDAATSGGAKMVRGVLIVSRDPAGLRNMYQATFLGELFELAGGKLALPGRTAVSAEEIIRANPDVIIDFSYGESAGAKNQMGLAKLMGPWGRLSTVSAVKNGRVYGWSDPHVLLLGPGVVDTARQMKELIRQGDVGSE